MRRPRRDDLAAFSSKEHVAMKNTRFNVAPVALLLLLGLVTLVAVHRALKAHEFESAAVKAGDKVVRDSHSTVAFVVVLFGYMMWTVLRAKQGKPNQCRRPRSQTRATSRRPVSGSPWPFWCLGFPRKFGKARRRQERTSSLRRCASA